MNRLLLGRIHSFQSMGAVDGPGLRYVIFMQGCPLRCIYCHNPDTWDTVGGEVYTPQQILEKILRYRIYFKHNGGVTVTGGEPLIQAEFVAELFRLCKQEGIHTALDTSGIGTDKIENVLNYTDLVLADLKFLTQENYQNYCHGDFSQVERFLNLTAEKKIPLWIRHVVVPNLTDGKEHIKKLVQKAHTYPNLEKIELLPFQKLCIEKYRAMGIPFLLADTEQMQEEKLRELLEITQTYQ